MFEWTVKIPEPDYKNDLKLIALNKELTNMKYVHHITLNEIEDRKSYLKYKAILDYFDDDAIEGLDATYKYNPGYIKRKTLRQIPKLVSAYYELKEIVVKIKKKYNQKKSKEY